MKYNFKKIEKKWQTKWRDDGVFSARNSSKKKKKYVLTEFPYPSGAGLHMGHLRGYIAGDVTARYLRMQGYEVMFPMGWDAFGLPAENYAIKTGIHPEITTRKNIANAKKQMMSWGTSFDWNREINTTDPEYYRWTQWLFLQFYKAGLAYQATGKINWCPKDKTGLANEEVIAGECERCGTKVEKRDMTQWFLKITKYADKLLAGLKTLDTWPEHVKLMQENWIGRSEGGIFSFKLSTDDQYWFQDRTVEVFTTRADTLFGVTFVSIAPEHPLLKSLLEVCTNSEEVQSYIDGVANKTDQDRLDASRDKTGVEVKGVRVRMPGTEHERPLFVADYVLASYGTGAVMGVPAHDDRDYEFAKKFGIKITQVIRGKEGTSVSLPFTEDGIVEDTTRFSGMSSSEARAQIIAAFGTPKATYRLRDWLFSRQRYWGEPIPIIHCEHCGTVPVPEKDLPVMLPKVKKYEPTGTGESPLAAIKEFVNTKCPTCKGSAKRETDTMPQWAGSSWYFLRYADSKNKKQFAKFDILKRWMPIDFYFGGMEHTTLHLLYSRFWNLFLYDRKLVPVKEPYKTRVPHGIILASDGEKMSKSKGNVVNPDDSVKEFGADTTRVFELFLGPHNEAVAWQDAGRVGVHRFLERVWTWGEDVSRHPATSDSAEVLVVLHKTIAKITTDLESCRFNTCVSALMELHNVLRATHVTLETARQFTALLHPFAPHLSEEVYSMCGGKQSLQKSQWPKVNSKYLAAATVPCVVQINGKTKEVIQIEQGRTQADVETLVKALPKIKTLLESSQIRKVIYVQDRLINFVVA